MCDPLKFGDPQAYAACLDNEKAEIQFDRVVELEQIVATRSVARLAQHLRQAEQSHHDYEQKHGLDVDWPTYYAKFLLGAL